MIVQNLHESPVTRNKEAIITLNTNCITLPDFKLQCDISNPENGHEKHTDYH